MATTSLPFPFLARFGFLTLPSVQFAASSALPAAFFVLPLSAGTMHLTGGGPLRSVIVCGALTPPSLSVAVTRTGVEPTGSVSGTSRGLVPVTVLSIEPSAPTSTL